MIHSTCYAHTHTHTSISYIIFFVFKVGRRLLLESDYWWLESDNWWLYALTIMWSISWAAVFYRTCENKLDDENDWMAELSFDDGLLKWNKLMLEG